MIQIKNSQPRLRVFFINKLFLFVGTVLCIEAFNNFLGDVEGFVCIKHVAAHLCEDEIVLGIAVILLDVACDALRNLVRLCDALLFELGNQSLAALHQLLVLLHYFLIFGLCTFLCGKYVVLYLVLECGNLFLQALSLLFDDVVYRVVLTDAMPSGIGVKSFLGEMKGQEGVKTVVVMQTLSGLTIDINDLLTKKVYQVIASPQAVIVREIDPAVGASKRDRVLVPDVLKSSASKRLVSSRTLPNEGLLYVDVLVCYDRNAKKWVESNGGGMTNFAQLAVMKMNSALVNTDIGEDFLFRLVGVAAIDAQAFDVYTALYAIDDDEPGWRDSKIFREKFGADIVSTFIDNGSAYGTTGVAWSMSSDFDIEGFSGNAYNVCSVRAVAQSHTMTHEVGHNMGAGHATAVNPEQCDPGPQLFSYSAGYYFTGTNNVKYHTIMAYADDGYLASYTEAPFFSSPDHSYVGAAVGDLNHNNTKTLRRTFRAVAGFRESSASMHSYTVMFDANGGECDVSSVKVADGVPLGIVPNVNREGYIFAGWFSERDAGAEVTALTVVDKDVVYYAHWVREVVVSGRKEAIETAKMERKRILLVSGRDSCGNTEYLKKVVLENASVKRKVFDDFVVWFNDCDAKGFEVWRYSAGLGAYTLPLVCAIDPYDAENFIERRTGFMGSEEFLSFVDQLANKKFTIVLHKNDGTGTECEVAVKFGKPTALPGAATELEWAPRRGFSFMGWSTAEKSKTVWKKDKAVLSKTVSAGETFHAYAIWQLKTNTAYAIQYIRNDGSGSVRTIGFNGGVSGKLNSVKALGFERRGYTFGGWATSTAAARAKKAWRPDMGSVSQPVANGKLLQIYAIWKLTPGYYSIRFNKNDGTGKWRELGYKYGDNTTLPTIANGLQWSRAGYKFGGWATSAANAANGIAWRGDKGVTRTPVAAGKTLNVYAIWKKTGASVTEVNRTFSRSAAPQSSLQDSGAVVSVQLLPGYYSGELADGSGTYNLLVDEGGETGYVYIIMEEVYCGECRIVFYDKEVVVVKLEDLCPIDFFYLENKSEDL